MVEILQQFEINYKSSINKFDVDFFSYNKSAWERFLSGLQSNSLFWKMLYKHVLSLPFLKKQATYIIQLQCNSIFGLVVEIWADKE